MHYQCKCSTKIGNFSKISTLFFQIFIFPELFFGHYKYILLYFLIFFGKRPLIKKVEKNCALVLIALIYLYNNMLWRFQKCAKTVLNSAKSAEKKSVLAEKKECYLIMRMLDDKNRVQHQKCWKKSVLFYIIDNEIIKCQK